MKRIIFIFLIMNLFFVSAQKVEIKNLDVLLDYKEVETSKSNFTTYGYSQLFVDKFNLSAKETELVGWWLDIWTTPVPQTHKNISIRSIDFFPNRFQEMYCLFTNEDTNKGILKIYSDWKIKGKNLYIKPYGYEISYDDNKTSEYVPLRKSYQKVCTIGDFNDIYVYDEIVDYSFLNAIIKIKDVQFKKDTVRSRITRDWIPSIFDYMETNEKIRNFYLNEDFHDPDILSNSVHLLDGYSS